MKTTDFSEAVIQMARDIPITSTITSLAVGTTYKVSLRALNDVGYSEVAGPIEVTTSG